MHHVMAGRRLMALRTVFGLGGRVQEISDLPSGRVVTRSAFPPEQLLVRVLIAVATGTVECVFFGGQRYWNFQETSKITDHLA